MKNLFIKTLFVFLLCAIYGQLFALENGDIMIVRDREKVDYYNHLFAAVTSESGHYKDFIRGRIVSFYYKGNFYIDKSGKLKNTYDKEKFYAYIEDYYNSALDFSVYLITYDDTGMNMGYVYRIIVNMKDDNKDAVIMRGRPDDIGLDDVCYSIGGPFSESSKSGYKTLINGSYIFSTANSDGERYVTVNFISKFNKAYESKKNTSLYLENKSNIVIVGLGNMEKMERYTKLFATFIKGGKDFESGRIGQFGQFLIPISKRHSDYEKFYLFVEHFYRDDKNFSIYMITLLDEYHGGESYRYYHLFSDEQSKQFYMEIQGYNNLGLDGLFYQIEMDELSKEFIESPFRTRKYIDIKELYKYNERQKLGA
jgi:hypothetical protein